MSATKRKLIDFLSGRGWVFLRNMKDTHQLWEFPTNGQRFTVPGTVRETSTRLNNYLCEIRRKERIK